MTQVDRLYYWASFRDFSAGLLSFPRPDGLADKPHGWLRINGRQMAVLDQARKATFAVEIAEYLRSVSPRLAERLTDEQLVAASDRWIREGDEFGFLSNASYCRWAYLQLLSGGRLSQEAAIRNVFAAPDRDYNPDQRMKILMERMIAQLREAG